MICLPPLAIVPVGLMAVYLRCRQPPHSHNCWGWPHSPSLASSSALLRFPSTRVLFGTVPSSSTSASTLLQSPKHFLVFKATCLVFLFLPPAVTRSWSVGSTWVSWSDLFWWSWWMKTCCLTARPQSCWRHAGASRRATSHRWRGERPNWGAIITDQTEHLSRYYQSPVETHCADGKCVQRLRTFIVIAQSKKKIVGATLRVHLLQNCKGK